MVTALGLTSIVMSVVAVSATSENNSLPAGNEGFFNAQGDDEKLQGPAPPNAVTSNYLFVAGSAFTPRTSAQTVTYPGVGCTYSNAPLTTSVHLPSGASVNGVRIYYYNLGQNDSLGMFFTQYNGIGGSQDLVVGTTTLKSGYASEYFAKSGEAVIDNLNQSYVLTGSMQPNLRLCGMRVFYDLP